MAIFGPILTPSPLELDPANRLQAPSRAHPFGTDNYGRDVLARVVEGARVSLLVGAVTAVCTAVLGCAVGLYAAYSRVADMILMRISDGLMAFPAILLAIAIMAALGQQTSNVVIAMTIVFTPYVARIVRSSALVVKEQTFVEALKAQGASRTRIIWINMAPNVVSPLIVQATFVFADSIITEAALSFLGAGVPPPAPSWGNMLLDGRTVIYNAWWMTAFPESSSWLRSSQSIYSGTGCGICWTPPIAAKVEVARAGLAKQPDRLRTSPLGPLRKQRCGPPALLGRALTTEAMMTRKKEHDEHFLTPDNFTPQRTGVGAKFQLERVRGSRSADYLRY